MRVAGLLHTCDLMKLKNLRKVLTLQVMKNSRLTPKMVILPALVQVEEIRCRTFFILHYLFSNILTILTVLYYLGKEITGYFNVLTNRILIFKVTFSKLLLQAISFLRNLLILILPQVKNSTTIKVNGGYERHKFKSKINNLTNIVSGIATINVK